MKFLYLTISFLFVISNSLNAQFYISGIVINEETGDPIPGVNVYLSGTTIGASTDKDGFYNFTTDILGRHDLVVSFIGFKTQIRSIILESKTNIRQNYDLEPDVLQLNEIRVIASNDEFLRQLDLFKTFFIGFDSNASETFIMNPEVLEFDEVQNKTRINVDAQSLLIIHNNALGYRYEVELKEVYFNPQDNTGFYNIYPRVLELEPTNRRTQRRWNSNRKKSFDGSSRHFFKSLAENRIRRNDFRIFPSEKVLANYSDSLAHIKRWYPSNWEFITENFNVFMLTSDAVRIEFNQDNNSNINQLARPTEVSSLDIRGFPEIIVVNKNGLIFNSAQIELFGHWSNTRFSNFLPLDYSN